MMRPCVLQIKNTSVEENTLFTFHCHMASFFLSHIGELTFVLEQENP